ncbi:hypothetical protein F4782DRAFT_530271 [Xylaria castorea]|nr:hypothetical protein F4782DRAFT_530271 [Xylaria castorea]
MPAPQEPQQQAPMELSSTSATGVVNQQPVCFMAPSSLSYNSSLVFARPLPCLSLFPFTINPESPTSTLVLLNPNPICPYEVARKRDARSAVDFAHVMRAAASTANKMAE